MGIKNQLETLLVLLGINSGKIMRDKANEVRKLLNQNGTQFQIVNAIMARCKAKYENWVGASIAQTQHVLDVPLCDARALVSEFSGEKTAI